MNKIATLGIDLAKSVFQLHGIDLAGKVVLRREVLLGSPIWRARPSSKDNEPAVCEAVSQERQKRSQ